MVKGETLAETASTTTVSGEAECRIESVRACWYRIPTEQPETDGTLEWDHTTLVVVEVMAGGQTGLGYTYSHPAAVELIRTTLGPLVHATQVRHQAKIWRSMIRAVRNLGLEGLAAAAISAIDLALWDLRARLLGLSLVRLLGAARDSVPVYGSGGFTSYDDATLRRQLSAWVERGIGGVKMKVGRDRGADLPRVRAARAAIGPEATLMVDANNAYHAREALQWAERFHLEADVSWLEQPVPHEDLRAMRFVRERAPAAVEITDGEYGYTPAWFGQRIEAGAADVLMPDITRCLGLTGFLQVAALCEAANMPVSSHCAPALHATAGCLVSGLRHCEYFFDHARIEKAVFEGAPAVNPKGRMAPDADSPGFGLTFKAGDAERMAVACG